MNPRILFICKGSARIGLGHVQRCRTVALAARERADVHVVLIGPRRIAETMLAAMLPSQAVESDAQAAEVCAAFDPDLVVLDLLDLERAAFESVTSGRHSVCISPIFEHINDVDMVFSRGPLPNAPRSSSESGPVVRIGARYAVIADHSRKIPTASYTSSLAMNPLSVAVSMGGADAPNRTLAILEAIREVPAGLLIWVLLGEEYAHSYRRLVDCVSSDRRHEIILARTTESMWRIMGSCCVAVLAGGITTYEAAYAGVPSIVTLDDDRKKPLISELVEAGACIYAGAPVAAALPAIRDALSRFDQDRELLLRMHRSTQNLLDDAGASRIVGEMLAECPSARVPACSPAI